MSIFYENRNGMLHAFDSKRNVWIGAQPSPWTDIDAIGREFWRSELSGPNECRALLEAAGVRWVWYHQNGRAWLNNIATVSGLRYQCARLGEAARYAERCGRHEQLGWVEIPVPRINSGQPTLQ